MKIAVLLTTFNRREKTLACLERLNVQILPPDIKLEIFLTDDASKDGTSLAVKENYPYVHVYHGTGSLYWAGGMRNTWKNAMQSEPDFYLLLNDDTSLQSNAIAMLLETSMTEGWSAVPAITIGSTCDDCSGKISYGGWRLSSKKYWKSQRIHSHTDTLECDFGNANIMLIPAQVVEKIGILADHFTHSLADYDYSLNAKNAGFKIIVAPGFLGTCTDDHGNNWKSRHTTLKDRIAYLKSPKGLAYKEYLRFIKDHFPLSYPTAFFMLWMKTFFPFIWDRFKKHA